LTAAFAPECLSMVRCWMGDESYQKAIADRRMKIVWP
jgi:hypothetical protein